MQGSTAMEKLLGRQFKMGEESIEERYFLQVRPELYAQYGGRAQTGTRQGRSLAEHLDSACQFVLTVSKLARVPDNKRALILAATAVHDLNKLDRDKRSVKTLARDRAFLKEQLKKVGVIDWVKTDEDLELVRRLIESHSDHNNTDALRFISEPFEQKKEIERWSAMLIGGDLYDLGIPEETRLRKVETKLTIALQRDTHLFKVRLSQERGYLTALLLAACEEVLNEKGLATLSINPGSQIFVGERFPDENLTPQIARKWSNKINSVFGGNVEQLVKASKDGIKVDPQAVQQNLEEAIEQVDVLLVKKFGSYKAEKISNDVQKYGADVGSAAVTAASDLGLLPISNAEEFAVSEGLKAAYLSYREANLSPKDAWDRIAEQVGLTPEQRVALEPFNPQYGRCLFAAKGIARGQEAIAPLLRDSFQLRQTEDTSVPQFLINAAAQLLNFGRPSTWECSAELTNYIEANPRQRSSLGPTSTAQIEELISAKMPPETKVQAFSNRLPGGMIAEPKRRSDLLSALSYQLLKVGANFPKATKQAPLYLHFALPKGSSTELQHIWRQFLHRIAEISEDGTVAVDEPQLYRDNKLVFKANKVVGLALPKRPEFIYSVVTIPLLWGDVNNSVALLKSLRLALEMSLALDTGFPFVLSANLEIEPNWDLFGRVEGIPSMLQPLLGSGQYFRADKLFEQEHQKYLAVETVLERLRLLGQLSIKVCNLSKRDDCFYDLAKASQKPLSLYYASLRWFLREKDESTLDFVLDETSFILSRLMEILMSEEEKKVSEYLREAAKVACEGKLWGNLRRRTGRAEPFSAFLKAIRSSQEPLDWETVFATLINQYHTRLDRIREHGVGNRKYEYIEEYYSILHLLFMKRYHSKPERILGQRKELEAAYLHFLREEYKRLNDQEKDIDEVEK